jgi:hypothetical protein
MLMLTQPCAYGAGCTGHTASRVLCWSQQLFLSHTHTSLQPTPSINFGWLFSLAFHRAQLCVLARVLLVGNGWMLGEISARVPSGYQKQNLVCIFSLRPFRKLFAATKTLTFGRVQLLVFKCVGYLAVTCIRGLTFGRYGGMYSPCRP